jgi:two-component system chemotaxis response regulator CheB
MPEAATTIKRDIVAIGASAGGIESLSRLLHALPRQLPASVLVVLHRVPGATSHLPEILARATELDVVVPREADTLRHGACFLSDADRQLTVGTGCQIHFLPDGFYRAHNIDALFTSLAVNAGRRTIGVVLSGLLQDGAFGLKLIKDAGGAVLVQCPEEAAYDDMPLNALKLDGPIDFVGPVEALAQEICRLTGSNLPAAIS